MNVIKTCMISFLFKLRGITYFDHKQISEIQGNIDEITCLFLKVLFSLVKNIKCYFTSEKYELLDDFRFFHLFPL